MFIVKKVHQSQLPLQYRTGRTTTWIFQSSQVVTTFGTTVFWFSKCLSCLTHSQNGSAVSLIFFCESEDDQSLVPRSRFLFGQHQTDRGKRPVFFVLFLFLSSVPCLRKGCALMGLHWLPAGQRVDFKIHSNTFKFFIASLPYIYVSIREPLSYYRPGKNLLSLQTLIDRIVF